MFVCVCNDTYPLTFRSQSIANLSRAVSALSPDQLKGAPRASGHFRATSAPRPNSRAYSSLGSVEETPGESSGPPVHPRTAMLQQQERPHTDRADSRHQRNASTSSLQLDESSSVSMNPIPMSSSHSMSQTSNPSLLQPPPYQTSGMTSSDESPTITYSDPHGGSSQSASTAAGRSNSGYLSPPTPTPTPTPAPQMPSIDKSTTVAASNVRDNNGEYKPYASSIRC